MKVALASLNYSAAHSQHLEAYVHLMESLVDVDYELFLAKEYEHDFEDDGVDCRRNIHDFSSLAATSPDLVLLYNIGSQDLKLINACKKKRIPVTYTLHEPFPGLHEALYEIRHAPRAILAFAANYCLCFRANSIIVPSKNAYEKYEKYMNPLSKLAVVFPLIFDDRFDADAIRERRYFSFIGRFSAAHGAEDFIAFMEYATDRYGDAQFLIATPTNITEVMGREPMQSLIEQGKLVVKQGRYLTNEEMDLCYRESICTWNVYRRSTQSGVVVNAMMHGTIPICSETGSMRDATDNGRGSIMLPYGASNEKLLDAYLKAVKQQAQLSDQARDVFLRLYHWESQRDSFESIVRTLAAT